MANRQGLFAYIRTCKTIFIVLRNIFNLTISSSRHEQCVPTCMNKPVNNHVEVGQLNHVQVCQQSKTSCAFLRVPACIRTMNFIIRNLHHVFSLLSNVKHCQRDNFGSQYPERYEPRLFHFFENAIAYLLYTTSFNFVQKYEIRIFHGHFNIIIAARSRMCTEHLNIDK